MWWGGGSVYELLLPYCDTAYVTRIDMAYQADTFFPDLDQDPEWELVQESDGGGGVAFKSTADLF